MIIFVNSIQCPQAPKTSYQTELDRALRRVALRRRRLRWLFWAGLWRATVGRLHRHIIGHLHGARFHRRSSRAIRQA